MKDIVLNLDDSLEINLYVQIYNQFKERILSGEISPGTKIPSLRRFAKDNAISVTTVETAYNQLLVEGYIESRPKSGYYVSDHIAEVVSDLKMEFKEESLESILPMDDSKNVRDKSLIYDEESFEFSKWKKCMNKVFNEHSNMLQTQGDVQGEQALRYEIAKYLYARRGVKCSSNQIVIGAGSQQLAVQLIRILRELNVAHAATEMPGYGPVREIFRDEGLNISRIPIDEEGIMVEKLPTNMKSLVYVNPSNQFPTGVVMPVARRYELIKWAVDNDSYILEDDYDSELRYFGKPVPALKGLDQSGRVIYLGSFSSTLFAAIKISYMVLPKELAEIFEKIKDRYSQTCSKAEQLCLAIYMEEGYYSRNIKRCRRMNAGKLETTMKMFAQAKADFIEPIDSKSGLAIMLRIHADIPVEEVCQTAHKLGLTMRPVQDLCTEKEQVVVFYFYRVSDALLRLLIKMFVNNMSKVLAVYERRKLQSL